MSGGDDSPGVEVVAAVSTVAAGYPMKTQGVNRGHNLFAVVEMRLGWHRDPKTRSRL
jgi:hypothetical protein